MKRKQPVTVKVCLRLNKIDMVRFKKERPNTVWIGFFLSFGLIKSGDGGDGGGGYEIELSDSSDTSG